MSIQEFDPKEEGMLFVFNATLTILLLIGAVVYFSL